MAGVSPCVYWVVWAGRLAASAAQATAANRDCGVDMGVE
jgi:hypothetical protein